ncbi:MAG TPA: hypothetical protein VGP82_00625 [Ktedonobacterales bacterium]|nr:hypothetical protein [Ktedonobacterales bacterium]
MSNPWQPPVGDDIRGLADETTELGIAAEDIFLNAATGLFYPDNIGALRAVMSAQKCKQMHATIHRRLLGMVMQGDLAADELRWTLELQRNAVEFLRMTECARLIAQYVVSLGGNAEWELQRAGTSIELLGTLVQQTRTEIRGSVVISTSRDRMRARQLLQEDRELERLFLYYSDRLDQAITYDPWNAVPLQQLLFIGAQMREIGQHAMSICDAVLFEPAQSQNWRSPGQGPYH